MTINDEIQKIVTVEDMRHVVMMIVATKANFWLCNHHTGQGSIQGYANKVSEVVFGVTADIEFTHVAHAIGHWCSTTIILDRAGIAGI